MNKIIEQLCSPLELSDVEARIGTCTAKGFSLLLYKTARTDIKRLNKVCGMNWSNKHSIDSHGNVTCEISVYNVSSQQWYSRHDTGSESLTEKEKGSYSDSLKRAGFRWGIGLELYESPFIFINYPMIEDTNKSTQYKKAYKLSKPLYGSDIVISKYKVVDGVPQVEIRIKGKVEFTNFSKEDHKEVNAKLSPHGAETTQAYLDNAETKLNECHDMDQLEACKKELMPTYKYFNDKLKDEKAVAKFKQLVADKENQLQGEK